MASKSLFKSARPGVTPPLADSFNEAGGASYKLEPRTALAQLAATGTLAPAFYADAEAQLSDVLALAKECPPEYVAKVAVWARARGHMKDMPAVLLAHLATRGPEGLAALRLAFPLVVDNGKMLRNFVQVIRSGQLGRKSLGARPKKLIRAWLAERNPEQLLGDSVGNDPSLADVVKMAHPKPADLGRAALYRYLIGKEMKFEETALLPDSILSYEKFKSGNGEGDPPRIRMELLTQLKLTKEQWARIAENGGWQQTRMNLNTYARHGAFKVDGLAERIAAKLRDPESVRRSRVFPYQLMVAYRSVSSDVPRVCSEALQDAMEIALENVPAIEGKPWVFVDISGSMRHPLTGSRGSATTVVQIIEAAALVAAAIARKNPEAEIVPFESKALADFRFNPRDSVITTARLLSSLPAGGTNCSAPMRLLNAKRAKGDVVIYLSDNESWLDSPAYGANSGGAGAPATPTETMAEWAAFKVRNPKARLACVDLQPHVGTQAKEREDILNLGGFSDAVFDVLALFAAGRLGKGHWAEEVEKVELARAEVAP